MIEDALLVWKLKRGDADALTRIYLTYKDRLLALAISLCGDRASAEDALHDVFVARKPAGELQWSHAKACR